MGVITAAFVLLFADGAVGAPQTETTPLPAVLARIDELYARRDDRVAFAEQQRLITSALTRAPQSYDVLWLAARTYFWFCDDPTANTEQRSRWGKQGWDLAERAVAVNPNGVAGHYYAAINMGNYAIGLGIIKALSMGMEGKFKDRLKRAGDLDPRYDHGSIAIAWGGFHDKLPWPKRDRGKAEQHLREALRINPHSLRARVFLATSFIGADRAPEAKALLDEVMAAPVGRYDAPEERRAKVLAAGLMPQLLAKLK